MSQSNENAVATVSAPRPEAFTGYLGMVIALASWGMMFAGLLFVYGSVRLRFPIWPPTEDFVLVPRLVPGLNTLVALLSSLSLHRGVVALRTSERNEASGWMAIALGLGALFLGLQWLVWTDLWAAGLRASSGIYGSVFYGLTGFHALHVACGLLVLLVLLVKTVRGKYSAENHQPVRHMAMFWHFVGVVWLFMYVTVYLI